MNSFCLKQGQGLKGSAAHLGPNFPWAPLKMHCNTLKFMCQELYPKLLRYIFKMSSDKSSDLEQGLEQFIVLLKLKVPFKE